MARIPDVLIIGGGIVGLSAAFALAKAGQSVTVLERGEFGKEASWAGAGIIPPVSILHQSDTVQSKKEIHPFEKLRQYAIKKLEAISHLLLEQTKIDNEFHRNGGIELLDENDTHALELWNLAGIAYSKLADKKFALPGSPLVPYQLDYGQVRNPRHLQALIVACQQSGVTLSPHTECQLRNIPKAGSYLIASGAWSSDFLPTRDFPMIKPVKGQIILFRQARQSFKEVLIVGHRYIVPRKDGRVLVGSTEEPEAGFDKTNSSEAIASLKSFAIAAYPQLADAEVEQSWAGLRPCSFDTMPIMGQCESSKLQKQNVFVCTGHYRWGVQLSAGCAELLKQAILGEKTDLDIAPFRWDRPPFPPSRPFFRS